MRQTKIIATFGPSLEDPKILKKVLERADVIRFNLAHGTWDKSDSQNNAKKIKLVQKTAKKINKPIATLVDLKGNKIRIGNFKKHLIDLKASHKIDVRFTDQSVTNKNEIIINADHVFQEIDKNDLILMDDGLIKLRVEKITTNNKTLHCKVIEGGLLSSNKGFEVENKIINKSGLRDEDKEDIKKLAKLGVDWIALSFVNDASDVNQAREVLSQVGSDIKLIAKIERLEALKQLYWIIKASDGIMVARGDLALESGPGELTGLQKNIIKQTIKGKKVAITATQMMESMINNPSPTRAEMTDVSNAVLDGSDAVMLSAETAIGKYPAETVEAMHEVCVGAESYHQSISKKEEFKYSEVQHIDEAIALSSMSIARNMGIKAIIALTESGSTALMLSRIRSDIPIYAFTRNEVTQRRVSLYRGVISFPYPFLADNLSQVLDDIREQLLDSGVVNSGDLIIVTSGSPLKVPGGTNSLRLITI